jgi:hypothetical protein
MGNLVRILRFFFVVFVYFSNITLKEYDQWHRLSLLHYVNACHIIKSVSIRLKALIG